MRLTDFLVRELRGLPNRLQVAYAVACSEHVLPLFEEFRSSSAPREALKLAWEYARGVDVSALELKHAHQEAGNVIPHIDIDESQEAYVSMTAAESVLETLDSILDASVLAASRAGLGALAAITVVLRIRDVGEFEDISDTNDLTDPTALPSLLVDEWKLQLDVLARLASLREAAITEDWIRRQSEIGLRVQGWWRSSRK
jgi:hypothetical protein